MPKSGKKIRYGVIGLGYIAQAAVLPAFRHASSNSELTTLFSDDPLKLKKLGTKYNVPQVLPYRLYDKCLKDGDIDAIYIALPNSMHLEYALRAANAGVHILCEKPLGVTVQECQAMIRAAEKNRVKLMTAYRLHFEKANLKSIEWAKSGKLGKLRIFNSVFTRQVKAGDIRLQRKLGGGSLYDLGIYCINAARYLFQEEPVEVMARSAIRTEKRFSEVDEMTSAILKFPEEKLASFISSFGAMNHCSYQILGSKGELVVENGYEYAESIVQKLKWMDGRQKTITFQMRDQFAPELIYFSNCILENKQPEPSGEEGLRDVRIIEALYRSAKTGKVIRLTKELSPKRRPAFHQEITRPSVGKRKMVRPQSLHQPH